MRILENPQKTQVFWGIFYGEIHGDELPVACHMDQSRYTPVTWHSWLENGSGLKMYFLLKMGIFQPAMLVYQRVSHISFTNPTSFLTHGCFFLKLQMRGSFRFILTQHVSIFTFNLTPSCEYLSQFSYEHSCPPIRFGLMSIASHQFFHFLPFFPTKKLPTMSGTEPKGQEKQHRWINPP